MAKLHLSWGVGNYREGDGIHIALTVPNECSYPEAVDLITEKMVEVRGRASTYFFKEFNNEIWGQVVKTGKFRHKSDMYNYMVLGLVGDVLFKPMTVEERLTRIEKHLKLV